MRSWATLFDSLLMLRLLSAAVMTMSARSCVEDLLLDEDDTNARRLLVVLILPGDGDGCSLYGCGDCAFLTLCDLDDRCA
eukprot:scaffold21170_cov73-Skeletonema_marinoi.AAC.1